MLAGTTVFMNSDNDSYSLERSSQPVVVDPAVFSSDLEVSKMRVFHHSISEDEELHFSNNDLISDESGIVVGSADTLTESSLDVEMRSQDEDGVFKTSSQESPTSSFIFSVRRKCSSLNSSFRSYFHGAMPQRKRSKSDTSHRLSIPLRHELRSSFYRRIHTGRQRIRRISEGSFFTSVRRRSNSIAEEDDSYSEYMNDSPNDQLSIESDDRRRRNSDQGAKAVINPSLSPSSKAKKSSMKSFFENFRPRAKSENVQTMKRPSRRNEDSGSRQDVRRSSDQNNDPEILATIQQGQALELGSGTNCDSVGAKKRSRSPMGGLVSRLKNMTTSNEAPIRKTSSCTSSKCAASHVGLPHPSDMPLDSSFTNFVDASQKRSRYRKTTSLDADALLNSYPPSDSTWSSMDGSVQVRHKDLFETLNKSMEGEGGIVSATAHAEHQTSMRARRASGPAMPSANLPTACLSTSARNEVQVTENDKYIIFKSRSSADNSQVDFDELRSESLVDRNRVFVFFLKKHRCYDLIPTSCKLLVFDHQLNVKKAFFALVYNGLRAAPLWDSSIQKFVGMLTVTDFILILHTNYKSAMVPMEELESQRISSWRKDISSTLKPFIWISPEATLLDAARMILVTKVHRLPIVDPHTGNVLYIMTHKRLLKFIYLHMRQLPMPFWLDWSLDKLKLGTQDQVYTVRENATLHHVFGLFVKHRISALPVVNAENKLTDIFSKFDVINLATNKVYDNLEISVKSALAFRKGRASEGVCTCTLQDTLAAVLQRIVTAEVHRLIVIDNSSHVIGVVSLSDILRTLVINYEVASDSQVADGLFVLGDPMEL